MNIMIKIIALYLSKVSHLCNVYVMGNMRNWAFYIMLVFVAICKLLRHFAKCLLRWAISIMPSYQPDNMQNVQQFA